MESYMPTAVIYARFSSSKQREASIDDQIRICTDYCQREGYTLIRSYSDYAISGRTDDRPQFQEMISNAGESDVVVVYMMDRFSRDPYDAPIYKKQLAKRGVRVISAMEYVDSTPDGIIMEKLLEGLAARESMVTSIRTKRGMEGNARKCLYNGDRVYGYAVEDGKYVIDEKQADYVREAFKRRLTREPVAAIARDFATRGVKTYSGRPCSDTMVWNMLSNEKYTGVYIWGDVRVDGGMPQIIDRDTFERVQGVKGRKQHKLEVYADYVLAGRAICGSCGRNMVGSSCKNHAGVRYDYYRCGKKCGLRHMPKDVVEGRIVQELRKMLNGEEATLIAQEVERAWKGTDRARAKEEALERLNKARNGIENIVSAIEDGAPYSTLKDRMEMLQQMEQKAKSDYEMHKHDDEFDIEDFVDFLRFGATLDDKTLLDAFVSQVVVFEDRLIVTLNYADKTKSANTPRQLDLENVRTVSNWLPTQNSLRTIAFWCGRLVISFPIAA
ncbi:MAG: recombinase family protein [Bacteroidales bacterium]|nr:recombinase family protein [Candidatus Colimorpha merdihippi]